MWQQVQAAFWESFQRAAVDTARLVPQVLIVLLVGSGFAATGIGVRMTLRRALQRIDIDRVTRRWACSELAWLPGGSISALVSGLSFWALSAAGALVALHVLEPLRAVASQVLAYLPRLLFALVILGLGLFAAHRFERVALVAAVNLQLSAARFSSLCVKWLVIVFTGALALEHAGVGGAFVTVCAAVVMLGLMAALLLAVAPELRQALAGGRTRAPAPGDPSEPIRHL